jgi:hypothetical protein
MADETDQLAGAIIAAFGGIRPMAAKLGVPVSTVQGWKQRDSIPAGRMAEIRQISTENDISLPESSETIDLGSDPVSSVSEPDQEFGAQTPPTSPAEADMPVIEFATVRRGGASTGVAVIALLVAVGAACWTWWSTEGPGVDGEINSRFSVLEGQIVSLTDVISDPDKMDSETLSQQIEAVRAEVAKITPTGVDVALLPLREELSQLSEELSAMAGQAGNGVDPVLVERLAAVEAGLQDVSQLAGTNKQAMSGGIVEFDTRLKGLEARITGLSVRVDGVAQTGTRKDAAATRAIVLTLSVSQLRRAIIRGERYENVLISISEMSSGDLAVVTLVETLMLNAVTGVSTRDDLMFGFPETAKAILDTSPPDAENDIVDQILDRARRIVRVRRVGVDVSADSMNGRVARAELRLEAGNVAGAVEILGELSEETQVVAQTWLTQAKAHIKAVAALETLERLVLERLRDAGGV